MFATKEEMQRELAHDRWYPERRWVDMACESPSLAQMPLDPDCGPTCMGFSYLPPRGPMLKYSNGLNWAFGAGLLLDATPQLWSDYVRCTAVSDSNSVHRVECGQALRADATLKASCGAHDNVRWSKGRDGCAEPYFCSNPFWFSPALDSVDAAADFLAGAGKDVARGCKFKASERERFEEVLHRFMKQRKRSSPDNTFETEVNFYVHEGHDAGVKAAILESLVGLLYDRTMGQRDVDYPHLQRLQRHLQQLGKRVPIIEINMESAKSLQKWDSSRMAPLNLAEPPYGMRLVWGEDDDQ
jgi:hypothetical protein